ncbi:hypothetical protein GYH30_047691 [Glycine max]|uniref:Non-haem dioxygenase N-terminal domain-containing protein n=1 Tax=Glycine max TaxID=3847 RepID=K7MMC3_SOYBN|nr:hypothetical protein GYH30_047691 [Glycine max]
MQVVEYDFLGKPTFAESKGASHIPSTNHSITDLYDDVADELAASIPVDDLSLLTSHDPQIHTKALYQLGKAYAKWGFFMLTNDETLEKLVEDVKKKSREFHDFPVEEKEFSDKCPFTPIRYGTNFYPEAENVHYWRDYLKVITFPEFNFPQKPPGYRESGLQLLIANLYPPCLQPHLALGMLPHSFLTSVTHNAT